MRIIGRDRTGRDVGCVERWWNEPVLFGTDYGVRLTRAPHKWFEGFREAAAWLRELGAVRLDCVG